jgi:TolB protein
MRLLVVSSALLWAATASGAPVGGAGWIAFDERTYFHDGGDAWEVFVVRPDGSGRRMVTYEVPAYDNTNPGWSPDGRKIAFSGHVLGGWARSGIFVINVDSSGRRRLTSGMEDAAGVGNAPAWSPDGRRIAFSRRGSIWTMGADGSDQQQLTRGRGDSQPAWSPDGRRIVFSRWKDLWLTGVNGGKPWRFARAGSSPSWSPDGRRIAFQGDNGGILVIDRDGAHRHRIGSGSHPSWSPDGRRIVCTSPTDYDIDVMDADGRNVHRVVKGYPETGRPVWGR